jgi:AbiV family abortive infection protein
MGTPRIPPEFRFTDKILKDLSIVSLENAEQLINEAKLLLDQKFIPRAYFLSVAAIEEIGKAYLCFESATRNLSDSAVTSKIVKSIENHLNKINAAFHTSILTSKDPRGAIQTAVDLMVALKNGREPSMYTDINYIDSKIYVPNSVVREIAAKDSVRLAGHCYLTTHHYINNFDPSVKSKVDDIVFGLKLNTFSKLMNHEDFWWYLVDNYENNRLNLNEIILEYHKEFFIKNKLFKVTEVE